MVQPSTRACIFVAGEASRTPAAGVTTPEAIDAAALRLVLRQALSEWARHRKTRGVRIGKAAGVVDVGVTTADAPPSVRRVVRLAAGCDDDETEKARTTRPRQRRAHRSSSLPARHHPSVLREASPSRRRQWIPVRVHALGRAGEVELIVTTHRRQHHVALQRARLVELRVRHQARTGLAVATATPVEQETIAVEPTSRTARLAPSAYTEGPCLGERHAGLRGARSRIRVQAGYLGVQRAT